MDISCYNSFLSDHYIYKGYFYDYYKLKLSIRLHYIYIDYLL